MKSIVSFPGGIILTLVLATVGYLAVKAGIIPANADSKPTALENSVANTTLDAVVERDTKGLKNSAERRESYHRRAPARRKLRDMPWRIGCQAFEPGSRLLYRGTVVCERWSRRRSGDRVVLEGEAWNPLHSDAELYHHAAGRGDLENRDVPQADG